MLFVTQTPQALLKKLKSTPSFPVTKKCIEDLAKLAIELGPEGLTSAWVEANAKRSSRRASAKPKSEDAAYMATAMTTFYKSKKMKSSEAAEALVDYSREYRGELPKPAASVTKGTAAALKWLISNLGDSGARVLVDAFVKEYR